MKILPERCRATPSLRKALTAAPLMLVVTAVLAVAGCGTAAHPGAQSNPSAKALAANPVVDPGSPLGGKAAPGFRLLDQFGHTVTLSQFGGKAILLAFVDSHCTTVCPLTTTSMLQAVSLLGPAGKQVQLIGIDANPDATRVADVHDYSRAHGMMHSWEFLTGSLAQLKQVWRDYHVYVAAVKNNIDHEPAIFLITPGGKEQSIFLTQMAYTGTDQQAQVLANATAAVLPGHPHVQQSVNLHYLPGTAPTASVALPVAGGKASGRTVMFGRGHPHLVVFFATWVDENTNLTAEMEALNGYQRTAAARGWPSVVAVDEASTETTPSALPMFLASLHGRLNYPVVVDKYGQLADGYGVQDQPWVELVSSSGKILFKNDGWFPSSKLPAAVSHAMSAVSSGATG
jgi:cytochrome oxidase Cu insertion factor (SCO1/SenC/PrrC family)